MDIKRIKQMGIGESWSRSRAVEIMEMKMIKKKITYFGHIMRTAELVLKKKSHK